MGKSLIKNYIYSVAYSLINVIIPVILIPYVSRVLQPDGIGAVSYAQNIASYFILFASLGIPNYGIREIARVNANKTARSQVFAEIFSINIISTFVSTMTYFLLVVNGSWFENYRTLLLIVGISLPFNCFNIDWFYRGMEEFRYITVRGYAVKIVAILAVFVFVKDKNDIFTYGLILTLATSANYILNIIYSKKYLSLPNKQLQLKKHIKSIVFMFSTAVAVEIYAQLDTTMLGFLCGDKYVGYYTNSIRLTRIVAVVITSIGAILLPRLSVIFETGDTEKLSNIVSKAINCILLISIPATIGLCLVSKEVVFVFFGETFTPAIVTMKILALLIPILSIGNIYGTQLMVAMQLEKKLTITVIIGAVVNVCLNFIMITHYQQNGAAVASVIAELVVMCGQIYISGNKIRTIIDFASICKLLVQVAAMTFVILCIKQIATLPVISLLSETVAGVVVFLIVGVITKNTLMLEVLAKFKRNPNS